MDDSELKDRFNPTVAEALKSYTKSAGFPSLVGIEVDSMEPGVTRCSVEIGEQHLSGIGLVHGGVISALIDHTLSITIYPLVEVGKWAATLEFKTNYTSWVKEGTLTATGRVESLRNTVAVVRVDVDNDGKPVAFAQGTVYVRDKAK